jgi:enamine deaminase RidA (YjgF/YER057c/UK114 family)
MSPAVVTQGGRTVWLSGQTATSDLDGKDIAWEFDAQVRTCFALMDLTLKRVGGNLGSLVHTTTYLLDARHGDRLVELRKEVFPSGRYPGTTLLTVAGFAKPGILVEIQGIAVVP